MTRSSGNIIAVLRSIALQKNLDLAVNCMALQCLPLRQKFMECSVINPALSLLMKHLDIGQR